MALKTKNTPLVLNSNHSSVPTGSEERMLRVNPEVNRRLDGFMEANSRLTGYYTQLVKEHPERAIRAFMLNKMFKYEAELRTASRQAPQAKEWLDQQPPTIRERVAERLQKINPFYREKAFVRVVAQEKSRIDFTPKTNFEQGMST